MIAHNVILLRDRLILVLIQAASRSFVAKSKTIFYFLQQTFSICDSLFWWKTSLYAGGKMWSIAFQPVSQECCETSWWILLLVLTCLNSQGLFSTNTFFRSSMCLTHYTHLCTVNRPQWLKYWLRLKICFSYHTHCPITELWFDI